MTPHEMATICRFSRNGVIPWQSVAVMLGRDRGALRSEWEALAASPITLEPPNIGPIDMLPEPECYRSTRVKGPGLRDVIMIALAKRAEAVDVLSGISQRSPESIRMRLSQMNADGLVEHDNRAGRAVGRTWSLTVFGREVYARETGKAAHTPLPTLSTASAIDVPVIRVVDDSRDLGFDGELPEESLLEIRVEKALRAGRPANRVGYSLSAGARRLGEGFGQGAPTEAGE